MKSMILAAIVATVAFTTIPAAPSNVQRSKSGASADEVLKQTAIDWENAYKSFDAATFERILADDWVGIDDGGNRHTKAEAIANLRTRRYVLKDFALTSTVRFYGNTAILVTNCKETSSYDGTDTSGRYVFTDIYLKQKDGTWKAVASQVTKKNATDNQ
jgi:ketosteroid isomerase-like protein